MKRLAPLPWLVALFVACGSRTPLFLDGPPLLPTPEEADGGVDSSESPDGADGAADVPFVPPAECAVTPPATTWVKTIYTTADTMLSEAYAVAVAPDGSIFAAGCGGIDGCADYSVGDGPCFVLKASPSGHLLFVHRFTDGSDDALTVGLSPDGQGGVVIGLEDDEGATLGGLQPPGCFVERLDGHGDVVFDHSFRGADCTTSFGFAGDGNGRSVLVTGCGTACDGMSGAQVISLDAEGNVTAQRTFPGDADDDGANTQLTAAAIQTDGTVLVAGFEKGGIDFGKGIEGRSESVVFATFDADLAPKATLVLDDAQPGHLQAIATPDGVGFVVTGTMDRVINFGGGPLTYTGDNNYGGTNLDIFLAKLTTRLAHVFSHSYGDTSSQNTTGLCADPDGTISWLGGAGYYVSFDGQVVSGDPTTPDDGFLVRLSPDGKAEKASPIPVGVGGEAVMNSLAAVFTPGQTPMACVTAGYVLAGQAIEPLDYGLGPDPAGGFIIKRDRP